MRTQTLTHTRARAHTYTRVQRKRVAIAASVEWVQGGPRLLCLWNRASSALPKQISAEVNSRTNSNLRKGLVRPRMLTNRGILNRITASCQPYDSWGSMGAACPSPHPPPFLPPSSCISLLTPLFFFLASRWRSR